MTGDAVDRSIQYLISLVDIERSERSLKDDAFLDVNQAGSALQLVENYLAIGGKHLRPVMPRTEKRGVHQHVEGIAPGWRGGRIGRGS